jgi:raffinose/stachyose/melibiose transport system substrate-binding protein
MKRMLKAIIILGIIIGLTGIYGLVGCKTETSSGEKAVEQSGETTEEATVEENGETAEEETVSEPIKITSWQNPHQPDSVKKFFDSFNAAQDKYVMESIVFPDPYYETLLNKWAAGERPDVVNMGAEAFRQLDPENNLLDLSDMDFVGRTLYPDWLEGTTMVNGKIYGPCILFAGINAMTYNKDIFNELDLSVPTNYEELKEVSQVLKDSGYIPIYEASGDVWPNTQFLNVLLTDLYADSGFTESGGLLEKINSNEADFTDPLYIETFERLKELQDLGYFNDDIASATFTDMKEAIMNDEAAMIGANYLQFIGPEYGEENVESKCGLIPMGTFKPGFMASPGYNYACWYIVKDNDAAKIEGAKEFIKYLTGAEPYEEYYQTFIDEYRIPPMFEGFEVPDLRSFDQDVLDAMDSGLVVTIVNPGNSFVGAHPKFDLYLSEMYGGVKTPQEVGEAVSADFRAVARDAGIEEFQD